MSLSKEKYIKLCKELDDFKSLLLKISNQTINKESTKIEEFSSWLFAKITAHVFSISKLIPKFSLDKNLKDELWDISSLAVLTRTIIDTFYVMYYIGVDEIEQEEQYFRYKLFEYHSEYSRLEKLKLLNSDYLYIKNIEEKVTLIEKEISENIYFKKLSKEVRKNIRKGNKAILLSNSVISEKCEVSINYYKLVFKHLSSYVHAYPFALDSLSTFRAGEDNSLENIGLILNYMLNYLSLAIRDFLKLEVCKNSFQLSCNEKNLINSRCMLVKNFDIN